MQTVPSKFSYFCFCQERTISEGKELASDENALIWDSVLVAISSIARSFYYAKLESLTFCYGFVQISLSKNVFPLQ